MTESEEKIRRYLLGLLDEAEVTAFEEAYFDDEALAADVREEEDILLEAYLDETLQADERSRLEERLNGSPDLQRRLQLIAALNRFATSKSVSKPSFVNRVRRPGWLELKAWSRRLIPAAALAVLTVALMLSPGRDEVTSMELMLMPVSLRAASTSHVAPAERPLRLRLSLPPDEPRGDFEIVAKRDGHTVWRRQASSSGSTVDVVLSSVDAGSGLLVLALRDSSGAVIAFYELQLTKNPE
ncbi:MAG: hypothetical protein AAF654_10865 [Myxococcota bacterium]